MENFKLLEYLYTLNISPLYINIMGAIATILGVYLFFDKI